MLFSKTFVGGVYPPEEKELTKKLGIEETDLPKQVVIPLNQHVGAPCCPLVKKDDLVKVGQKIGDSDKFISALGHASVSGKVIAVEPRLNFAGQMINSVVIESDGKQDVADNIKPYPIIEKISVEEIIKAVRQAGIVKLSPPKDKKIDTLIINGAECEPYLTSDYRIMLDDVFNMAYGIDICKKVLGADQAYIGIEDNKPVAIQYLRKKLNKVKVVSLKTKYPQGLEKQLIKAVLGRRTQSVMVVDVAAAAQISRTLKSGMPLIDRVVTVTGKYLRKPSNLKVRIGTLYRDLIEQCGGVEGEIRKVVCGGPMMGIAVPSLDVPVQKGTSGIIVFTEKEIKEYSEEACIRCGKCSEVCPVFLNPVLIADYAKKGDWGECKRFGAMNCIECGACSYVCGSRREIVQLIKLAKEEIIKRGL